MRGSPSGGGVFPPSGEFHLLALRTEQSTITRIGSQYYKPGKPKACFASDSSDILLLQILRCIPLVTRFMV
jgi:hypothetical protein